MQRRVGRLDERAWLRQRNGRRRGPKKQGRARTQKRRREGAEAVTSRENVIYTNRSPSYCTSKSGRSVAVYQRPCLEMWNVGTRRERQRLNSRRGSFVGLGQTTRKLCVRRGWW